MAYASLAGVPPVYGLYAALAGLVVYALLGTSRQLNVGPSSSIAVLSAATIAPLAVADGERFLVLSAALAVLTGVILVAAGVARLGFVAEFLAKPVLAGYFVGLSIVIAVSQVPKLLGLGDEPAGFFRRVWNLAGEADAAHGWTVAVGLGTLALLLVLRATMPRVPGPLVAVALGVLASRALDLEAHGVAVVGEISSSLPDLALPGVGWSEVNRLLAGAFGVAILAYSESVAAARSFAAKHGYEVDPNRELIAMGAANIGSGLLKGFPIDASVSRTAVADDSGQRSQLAGLVNAGFVLTTILLLTQFFADLPQATLAAIIIAAVLPLMRTGELRRLRRLDEIDFALALVCLMGVLLFGVLGGLALAVVTSLGALVYRTFRPHTAVLGRVRAGAESDEDFGFRDIERHPEGETYPGLVIFRFDQEIFFANARLFRDYVRELTANAGSPLQAILLDAAAITHVDTTGLDVLQEVHRELSAQGITLMLARVKGPVHDILERAGLVVVLGRENVFPTVHAGVSAYLGRSGSRQ
jgi:high affinity sulfate transporter 1